MKNSYLINHEDYAKQKRQIINYKITIEDLGSFYGVIENVQHIFNCDLFFFSEENNTCIKYKIESTLKLICQNSLDIFNHNFNVTNTVILVPDDRLTKNSVFEVFICDSQNIDLREIIKEEILLNLPLVPKKNSNTCKITKTHS